MAPVLGIDFGTTNTAAAWVDDAGALQMVPVLEDQQVLPSVVCYHRNGSVLVGQAAREFTATDPRHTVSSVKRFLGRPFSSEFVARNRHRFAWPLREGSDQGCVAELYDQATPLADVAYQIIERMLELANIAIGEPVNACVLSVPAHYSHRQRRLIRQVAERLVTVIAMINEPTAAALYYADQLTDVRDLLVYDLGGGTFDATVLRLHQETVEVLATGGDAFLGGDDFDQRVVDALLAHFEASHHVDLSQDPVVQQRVRFAAENAKIALSTRDDVRVQVPCVTVLGERFIDMNTVLTRRELEALCAPVIERTLGLTEEIIGRAGLSVSDIDALVLVGGQASMPAIQSRLMSGLGIQKAHHQLDQAVAAGAAILGWGQNLGKTRRLIDVLSLPISVAMPGTPPEIAVPSAVALPALRHVHLAQRPPPGAPLTAIFYEAVSATAIERDIIGSATVPASWLDANGGELALEVQMDVAFGLSAALYARFGGRLPLDLEQGKIGGPVPVPLPFLAPLDTGVARLSQRIRARVDVDVTWLGSDDILSCESENLSLSGSFLRTGHTFDLGTRVTLHLATSGAMIDLNADVIRCLQQADVQHTPDAHLGVGVRFVGNSPAELTRFEAYLHSLIDAQSPIVDVSLDFEAELVESGSVPEAQEAVVVGELIERIELKEGARPVLDAPKNEQNQPERIRLFLAGVAQNNLYRALGLGPLAKKSEVQNELQAIGTLISKLMPSASGPFAERLLAAEHILRRTANLLLNPSQRLVFDFKCGHTYVEERKNQIDADPTLLREAWHRAHPDRVEKAAIEMTRAHKEASIHRLERAIQLGEQAQHLDPFNDVINLALAQWREQADDGWTT